ncbi:MAG: DivIVA domain-containing protein [candidate division Zixibacteria bacterium]|nr:DivIVA domain-containing protein [candidate division Zixibacteria bacterium]
MKITPLDIKKQEFETRFRGFDKTEVASFLEMVSEEVENLIRENMELKEKLKRASDKLTNYTKIEAALQNTLVATQESAEQMKVAAEEKAELIVREANSRADKIVDDIYEKITDLRREYSSLKNQKAAFLVNFRSLLDSQLNLLGMMEKQAAQIDRALIIKKKAELTDSDVDKVVEEFTKDNEPISDRKIDVQKAVKDNK